MLIERHLKTPAFVKISEAKFHDKNFIQYLNLPVHNMIVFDRAYKQYLHFARFTEKNINFVCRLQKNVVYPVVQELFYQTQTDTGFGVLKEEYSHLKYTDGKYVIKLCLRKATYRDNKGRIY